MNEMQGIATGPDDERMAEILAQMQEAGKIDPRTAEIRQQMAKKIADETEDLIRMVQQYCTEHGVGPTEAANLLARATVMLSFALVQGGQRVEMPELCARTIGIFRQYTQRVEQASRVELRKERRVAEVAAQQAQRTRREAQRKLRGDQKRFERRF